VQQEDFLKRNNIFVPFFPHDESLIALDVLSDVFYNVTEVITGQEMCLHFLLK
jgi:hypothetical protein